MGSSESHGSAEPDFALPQQQIVRGGQALRVAPHGAVAHAKHSTTSGVKLPVVWDKGTLRVDRVGDPRAGTWRLSVEFAAAVPCTLEVHVRCRESQEAGCVAFQRLDAAGPPSVAQALGPGTHTAVLSEEAVNLVRWPLHRYWKYSKQEPDVVPVALSLRCADGTQSILHAFLDPVTTEEMQSDGSGLRAAIRMHKVVVQGAEYPVEEIYGIAEVGRESAHDESGVGEPCVICLSEPRTTALLPCRHLSTCEECAKQLKVRADRCPICRAEVKGLQAFDMK